MIVALEPLRGRTRAFSNFKKKLSLGLELERSCERVAFEKSRSDFSSCPPEGGATQTRLQLLWDVSSEVGFLSRFATSLGLVVPVGRYAARRVALEKFEEFFFPTRQRVLLRNRVAIPRPLRGQESQKNSSSLWSRIGQLEWLHHSRAACLKKGDSFSSFPSTRVAPRRERDSLFSPTPPY
jgi:hypothetical protein